MVSDSSISARLTSSPRGIGSSSRNGPIGGSGSVPVTCSVFGVALAHLGRRQDDLRRRRRSRRSRARGAPSTAPVVAGLCVRAVPDRSDRAAAHGQANPTCRRRWRSKAYVVPNIVAGVAQVVPRAQRSADGRMDRRAARRQASRSPGRNRPSAAGRPVCRVRQSVDVHDSAGLQRSRDRGIPRDAQHRLSRPGLAGRRRAHRQRVVRFYCPPRTRKDFRRRSSKRGRTARRS